MELKRDEIIKALECCGTEDKCCSSCPLAKDYSPCSKTMADNALSLIKELTAKTEAQDIVIAELRKLLEKANHDADRYARKIKELTEENESLKQAMEHEHASFMEIFGQWSEKCDRLTEENERLRTSYETVAKLWAKSKADTVRKMQSEIEARCIKGGIYPAFVKSTIDQIAKELIEQAN